MKNLVELYASQWVEKNYPDDEEIKKAIKKFAKQIDKMLYEE